jgi:hypothetical protein
VDSRGLARKGLTECGNNDNHQLNTVCDGSLVSGNGCRNPGPRPTHPLTTDNIGQPTEQKLSTQGTNGSGHFDAKVLVGAQFTTCSDGERTNHEG